MFGASECLACDVGRVGSARVMGACEYEAVWNSYRHSPGSLLSMPPVIFLLPTGHAFPANSVLEIGCNTR